MSFFSHAGRSLRARLLAGTLVWVVATIVVASWSLSGLFQQHVTEQFRAGLDLHLEQLTARLAIDSAIDSAGDSAGDSAEDPVGTPILTTPLSDPRLSRPYSGLYWQIDRLASGQTAAVRGMLRSRSLWDSELEVPDDTPVEGEIHEHRVAGPDGSLVGMVERIVYPAEQPQQAYRLIVAADARLVSEPVERFNGLLVRSLAILGFGLIIAVIAQVLIGLYPLGQLRRALMHVREGGSQRIDGSFPLEIQPLVDDFNEVLRHNAGIVSHARTQAGNLAHALRTPLTILGNAAARPDPQLPQLVTEQVAVARRQIDYHLARARAAAAASVPGVRSEVRPLVVSLVRVMERLYHDKKVTATIGDDTTAASIFRGEKQDLQEILGNLLDNAWKWTTSRVDISFQSADNRLTLLIDDDGPGLAAEQRQAVLARGVRADERVPGTGLGLAIVSDLVQLYDGSVTLEASPLGGLRVRLVLPAVPRPS